MHASTLPLKYAAPNLYDDLVCRIQARDADAVEELYLAFQQGLRWHIRRRIGIDDVEDLLHDIFIAAIHAIQHGQLRDPQRLAGFMMGIARHKISEALGERVKRRRQTSERHDFRSHSDPLDSIPCSNPGPHGALVARERVASMVATLRDLGDRDREILVRFHLNGETAQEICVAMKLTETQFRLLKSRTKARLVQTVRRKSLSREMAATIRRFFAGLSGHTENTPIPDDYYPTALL